MKHTVFSTTAALAHEIAALRQAPPADLKERWRALYCSEPPRRISRDLLVRAVAYRIQEKALGGLKPATRRLLAKVTAAASAHRPMRVAPPLGRAAIYEIGLLQRARQGRPFRGIRAAGNVRA